MQLWNTPLAFVRSLLVATIALGVVLLVATTTQATSAKQQAHAGSAAGQTVPARPAGPRGPITLTCNPNGVAVVGTIGPAGPQGPVGVNCAASPNS
jgi:hypothetical protein